MKVSTCKNKRLPAQISKDKREQSVDDEDEYLQTTRKSAHENKIKVQ